MMEDTNHLVKTIQTIAQFEQEVIYQAVPVVLFFSDNWSTTCLTLEREVTEIAEDLVGEVSFVKINKSTSRDLCRKLGVDVVPAVLVMLDGEIMSHAHGTITKGHLEKMLGLVKLCMIENAA